MRIPYHTIPSRLAFTCNFSVGSIDDAKFRMRLPTNNTPPAGPLLFAACLFFHQCVSSYICLGETCGFFAPAGRLEGHRGRFAVGAQHHAGRLRPVQGGEPEAYSGIKWYCMVLYGMVWLVGNRVICCRPLTRRKPAHRHNTCLLFGYFVCCCCGLLFGDKRKREVVALCAS